jgi:copper transport protein
VRRLTGRPITRRVLGVALLAAVLLGGHAAPASAHAILTHSAPVDGSTLDRAPTSLTLQFDEEVLTSSAVVTLRSGDGVRLASTGTGSADLAVTGPDEDTTLTVELPSLERGTYGVTWQVQSADDLHLTSGTVVFGVGEVVAARPTDRAGPAPDAASAAVHWLDLLAVAALVGAALMAMVVLPRAGITRATRRRLTATCWQISGWAAAFGSVLGLLVMLDAAGGPAQVGTIVTVTAFGKLWVVREALLLAVASLVLVSLRRWGTLRGRLRPAVAVLAVGASLVALAGSSHLGSAAGRPAAVALLSLHLAAGAAWAGGVLILVVLVAVCRADSHAWRTPLFRAFGVPAAVCLALIVTTGIAVTGRQVASVDALLTTAYGRILLVKVALVGVAGLLGLATAWSLRLPDRVLVLGSTRRTWAEVAILAAVLAAAAALSVGTPARGPAFAPAIGTAQPKLAAQLSDLFETLDVAPNRVGQSWLRVSVDQTRRPEPAVVSGVFATLVDPDGQSGPSRALVRSELANHWELPGVDLTAPGGWEIIIGVQRQGRPDVVWRVSWTVSGGPAGAVPAVVSDRPWASVLDGLAVSMLVLTLLAALVSSRVVRRRRLARDADVTAETPESEHRTLVTV